MRRNEAVFYIQCTVLVPFEYGLCIYSSPLFWGRWSIYVMLTSHMSKGITMQSTKTVLYDCSVRFMYIFASLICFETDSVYMWYWHHIWVMCFTMWCNEHVFDSLRTVLHHLHRLSIFYTPHSFEAASVYMWYWNRTRVSVQSEVDLQCGVMNMSPWVIRCTHHVES